MSRPQKHPILKVGIWAESFYDRKLGAKVVPWASGHYLGYVYIFEGEPERNRLVYFSPNDGGGFILVHVTGPVDYMITGQNSILIDPTFKVDPDADLRISTLGELEF